MLPYLFLVIDSVTIDLLTCTTHGNERKSDRINNPRQTDMVNSASDQSGLTD